MENTALSRTGKALRLGPGNQWGDVLEFAPPEKYSYPHGQCKSVGVGGYLLGGGVNWLGTYNKYGYGAEHILKMKVYEKVYKRRVLSYCFISGRSC